MAATKNSTSRRRTKGAGGVFQDARGVWHFRRDVGPDPTTGKRRIIEATGKVKGDARARFDKKIERYERTGLLDTGRSPYLRDYCDRWLEAYRLRVRPNSWTNSTSHLKTVCSVIGSVRLNDLRADHMRLLVTRLSENHSSRTVHDYYGLLQQVLDDAVREELIRANPCRMMRAPRWSSMPMRILGEDQPKKLIETISTLPREDEDARRVVEDEDARVMWALLFELAFSTGMREGERYALMPYELERRDGVPGIFVQQQLQRYVGKPMIPSWMTATHVWGSVWLVAPKTMKGYRFVPVSESLWERLWDWIRRRGIGMRELVFRNRFGRPVTRETERYRWKRALEDAGLPYVKLHSARHWAATRVAEAGASEDERKAIFGHTSIEVTAGYTHWSPKALSKAMDKAIPDLHAASSTTRGSSRRRHEKER